MLGTKELKDIIHRIRAAWDRTFSPRPKLDRDRWRFYNLLK
jgi:hypothetical protein